MLDLRELPAERFHSIRITGNKMLKFVMCFAGTGVQMERKARVGSGEMALRAFVGAPILSSVSCPPER